MDSLKKIIKNEVMKEHKKCINFVLYYCKE